MDINTLKNNNDCINELVANFQDEINTIFVKYRKDIVVDFTNQQITTFDKMLKNKKVNSTWITHVINLNNGDKYFNQIINKVVSEIVGKNNVSKFYNDELTTQDFAECFANSTNVLKQKSFCKIFGISYDEIIDYMNSIVKKVEEEDDSKIIEEKEKKIKRLEKQIAELRDENKKIVNTSKTNIENLRASFENKINNKDEQIRELEEKISLNNVTPTQEYTTVVEEISPEQKLNKIFRYLRSEYQIGVIESSNIKIEERMVAVKPIFPILKNVSLDDKKIFKQGVTYRGDYSSFMHFIDANLIEEFCGITFNEYLNYSYDDKYDILLETFSEKIIIFKPEFVQVNPGEPYKLNANIVKICDVKDFYLSSCIPVINKEEFEKIKQKEEFKLEGFSAFLNSTLKYVLFENTLYEVNCFSSNNSEDDNLWISSDGLLRKTKFQLNHFSENEDFIISPDKRTIYIKNECIDSSNNKDSTITENELIETIEENALVTNLCYSQDDIKNFHISLKSSKLVILAGPSGIGKTRLPLLYAKTINLREDTDSLRFITISPSFLEPNDLLGFVKPFITNVEDKNNDILSGEYQESSTMLVTFLKRASEEKDKLHMVIFDEMNLSQIEYWFAPFISLLEKETNERVLQLYSTKLNISNSDIYPDKLPIGDNVVFVGTINTDETTKHISDRLNDRAIIINLKKKSFASYKTDKDVSNIKTVDLSFTKFQTFLKENTKYIKSLDDREVEFFDKVHELISSVNPNKGVSFRNIKIVSNYLANSNGILERKVALDYAFKQTILSKLNGSRNELEQIINIDTTTGLLSILNEFSDISDFEITRKTINEKINDLALHGYTR